MSDGREGPRFLERKLSGLLLLTARHATAREDCVLALVAGDAVALERDENVSEHAPPRTPVLQRPTWRMALQASDYK